MRHGVREAMATWVGGVGMMLASDAFVPQLFTSASIGSYGAFWEGHATMMAATFTILDSWVDDASGGS